jgi:NAD-dependent SIR2 family protein deacetylase
VITQNVDGLHQAAGTAPEVVDLHGSLDRVVCLTCGDLSPRTELERRLDEANPAFDGVAARVNPDGDVELADEAVRRFQPVDCAACGSGMLKPDVVFFGENVPRDVVATAQNHLAQADGMLIVGSSLMVYSGFRFVKAAADRQIPIVAINLGRTRADDLLTLKVEERCEAALAFLL